MALAEIMSGIVTAGTLPATPIAGLTHDSRRVGPGYLFVALPGQHVQGTDFVPQAVQNGAAAIAGPAHWQAGTGLIGPDGNQPLPYLGLDDLPAAYSRMAANFYRHPSRQLSVVGITGTNGKTTTAELLSAILNAHRQPTATLGTLGLRWNGTRQDLGFTTPEADSLHKLLAGLIDEGMQGVVMEVSSHALKQARVDHVDFDAAVFTNFSQDHLDYHPDLEDYLAAKPRLFQLLLPGRPAIINGDDPHADAFLQAAQGPIITYGHGEANNLRAADVGLSLDVTVANLVYGNEVIPIESRLVGAYNLQNIMAAAATALALGVPPDTLQEGIASVTAIAGRLESLPSRVPGKVFIDYAHTPDAYTQVLETVRQLLPGTTRLVVLFGAGGDRDRSKRPLMAAQAETFADELIITSDNPRTEPLEQINADIVKGLRKANHVVISDRREALHHALAGMTEGSLLLILGKGREDYEIIGTEKVTHNDVEIVADYQP